MIYVFYGADRPRIQTEVERILGKNYEVFEGENLGAAELVNLFVGNSLFESKRRILVKDLTSVEKVGVEGSGVDKYAELTKLAGTEHLIVIWETVKPMRKSYREFVKKLKVTERKFELEKPVSAKKVFDIYGVALRDGWKAVRLIEEIEAENDPYRLMGLLATQALKEYQRRPGRAQRRALKILAEIDQQMKTTALEPWLLVKSGVMRLGS